MNHILPLSQPIREALIELYFEEDDEIQEKIRNDVDNKDCLISLYFGKNESLKQTSGCYDSLRNFPMRLNTVEDIKLDKYALKAKMEIALTVIHWKAKIDDMKIEFVLRSAAATPYERRGKAYTEDTRSKDLPPSIKVNWPLYFTKKTTHC